MFTSEIRIPEDDLRHSLFVRRGSLPVVLTVPHDGFLEKIARTQLLKDEVLSPSPRDVAVRAVAKDIYTHVWKTVDQTPGLVICLIKRKFRTVQTQRYFEKTSINLLSEAGDLNPGRQVLHIDLHGFSVQPEIGDYDLIFGTDHRKSVTDSNVDIEFADFLTGRGYRVYLPTNEPQPRERYGACGLPGQTIAPLVKEVMAAQIPNVNSIQVEIARKFRQRGSENEGKKLAEDIGDFFIEIGLRQNNGAEARIRT